MPRLKGAHLRTNVLLISILLIVVIFPLRLVREANPDWRPLNWLSTFVLLGLSLIEIYRQGGPRYVSISPTH